MIKSILIAIICLGILFSVQTAFAEEELPLPEGKNIKEWESISAVLVAEKRFDEAIIYLDKILEQDPDNLKALTNKAGLLAQLGNFSKSLSLSDKVLEIDPDRISALTNKAIALKMLGEYEKSIDTFGKILDLNPENELAKKSISRTLAEMPTVTTANSKFIVHIQIIVRDSENNLLGVFESTNARYLPSKFFDIWWDKLDSKGMIFKENGNEIWKAQEKIIPEDDHLGVFTWETEMGEWKITLFEAFVPMMEYNGSEKIEVSWTIIKN